VSIYASRDGVVAREYEGSHVAPWLTPARECGSAYVGLATISDFVANDNANGERNMGWLRLSIDSENEHAACLLTPTTARTLAMRLTAWADEPKARPPRKVVPTEGSDDGR
jgi:hypothetical protein